MLTSCASIPDSNSPDNFSEYSSEMYFLLENDFKYIETKGFLNVVWEYGLTQGKYIGKFQDNEGFYFVGPDKAACLGNPSCKGGNLHGGIWVSKSDSKDIRFFYIDGASDDDNSVNMGWIYFLSLGRYVVQTPNNEFAKKMQVSLIKSDT